MTWGGRRAKLHDLKGARGLRRRQQAASNRTSRSLALRVRAIQASAVYLLRCDVEAGGA